MSSVYSISRSVGIGGSNQKKDVAMVQFLLNCVSPEQGGANPELVKDGICGPKTVGAIQHFQRHCFGTSDRLVESGKQTMAQLNARHPRISPATHSCHRCHGLDYRLTNTTTVPITFQPIRFNIIEPGLQVPGSHQPANRATVYMPVEVLKPIKPLDPLSAREQAITRVPDGDSWIAHAMRVLQGLIECGGDPDKLNSAPGFAVLQRHFHLTTDALKQPGFFDFFQPLNTILLDLKNTYIWMSYVLRSALKEPVFINNPVEDEADPETAFVPELSKRDGRIRFTPLYLQLGKLHQTLTLVHEASHFVSNVIVDYYYRRKNPGEYDKLASSFAMQNADSYAYFAFHCVALGMEPSRVASFRAQGSRCRKRMAMGSGDVGVGGPRHPISSSVSLPRSKRLD